VTEAGDFWEYENLGGRLGMYCERASTNVVAGLYLITLKDGKEVDYPANELSWLEDVLNGEVYVTKGQFPMAPLTRLDEVGQNYRKLKALHKCDENVTRGLELKDNFIKNVRPGEKRGRE
jgi:hypothetical protein